MPSLIYFIESGDILNDNFNILKTMQTVAKTTQSKLDYDKTYRGYVISQNSNGKYKIKINGHIYENVDNPSGYTISSGDVVRVTFPQNNASQCYICLGSTKEGVVSNVKSVNGKTGDVQLTQDDVPNGSTYVRTHNDFTTEDKNAISKNAQDITGLQQSKQDNITGGASSITSANLGANKALVSNASGKVAVSNVTSTELGYLSGVTSNIQEQADEINTTAQNALTAAQDAQSNASSALTEAQSKAPTNHASTATTYGKGTLTNYGHVKLSDSILSTSSTDGGTAATPYAVKLAYDLANRAVSTLLGSKKIICGWDDVGYKSTGQTDTPIDFKTTFTAKPVVLIGQPFNSVVCTVFYDSVTTTGFTVNVPSVGSTTLAHRKMAWVAIGDV